MIWLEGQPLCCRIPGDALRLPEFLKLKFVGISRVTNSVSSSAREKTIEPQANRL